MKFEINLPTKKDQLDYSCGSGHIVLYENNLSACIYFDVIDDNIITKYADFTDNGTLTDVESLWYLQPYFDYVLDKYREDILSLRDEYEDKHSDDFNEEFNDDIRNNLI